MKKNYIVFWSNQSNCSICNRGRLYISPECIAVEIESSEKARGCVLKASLLQTGHWKMFNSSFSGERRVKITNIKLINPNTNFYQ